MRFSTRTATNVGLLAAISIVLTRAFSVTLPVAGTASLRLSFGEIPIMLAGILFGPWAGAAVGAAADLIGYAINPLGGPYFPGFSLSAALSGVIPGLLLYKRRTTLTWWRIGITVFITDLITGVFLNTLWLAILFGSGFFILLPARLGARLLTLPVYTVTLHLVSRAYALYRQAQE